MRPGSFVTQPDFKAHPLRGLFRRVLWRLHWRLHPGRPVVVRNWWRDTDLVLAPSGAAAQVFYRTFSSSGIVQAMIDTLREGMVAVDIGAHVGEYTMIAAALVGPRGKVYAFEPQCSLARVIKLNAARNGLCNVSVLDQAVADRAGLVQFRADRKMEGWIVRDSARTTTVASTTLDDFVAHYGVPRINLIKIDAGGNELAVLQGGKAVLNEQGPPIICKFYHPEVVQERFGYHVGKIIEGWTRYGYNLYLLDEVGGPTTLPIRSLSQLLGRFEGGVYCLHLLGVRA